MTVSVSDVSGIGNVQYWYQMNETAGPSKHVMQAQKAMSIVERACELTGHFGACGLVNFRYSFEIGGRFLDIPNPLHGMWRYIEREANHG